MCTNYCDRFQREEGENPTVGIVLCSDKNEAMVKITLPENNEPIFTPSYQLYLPSPSARRSSTSSILNGTLDRLFRRG